MKPLDPEILKSHTRISIDPDIMGGTPCIKGTRIPLYVILDNLEAGSSFDEILQNYPTLTKEDIQGAIRFSAYLTSLLAHANPSR